MFKNSQKTIKTLGMIMLATMMIMIASSCSVGPRCASGKAMKNKAAFLKF